MGEDPGAIREEIEQTRADMGETVEALGYKTDVKSRARDKVESVKAKVSGATPDSDEAKASAKRAVGIAQENPLGLAIGSVAVGFVAGLLVPSTRIEDEKVGPIADDVKQKVKETGQEAVQRGTQVAQEAAASAKEAAQESGRGHADELRESAAAKAQDARPDTP